MSSYLVDPFPRFINKESIKTIFEIGSRDAQDALALNNYYHPEKLLIFEANPAAQDICAQAISGVENTTLIRAAAAEVPGFLSFFPVVSSHQNRDGVETNNFGASSLFKASGLYGETYIQEEIKVPSKRVDAVCEEFGIENVDLVCMDVQGAEISVLKSFGDKIFDVKYIITECTVVNQYVGQAQLHDINTFLSDRGFRLVAVNMEYWGFGNFLYVNRNVEIPIVGS